MAVSKEAIALQTPSVSSMAAIALDALPQPVLLVDGFDARFTIILANAAARELLGAHHSPLIGASALDFVEHSSRKAFVDALGRTTIDGVEQLQQLDWVLRKFDCESATRIALLPNSELGSAVMLTLPQTDPVESRFREVSANSSFSRLVSQVGGPPRLGRWEQGADEDSLGASQTLERITTWLKLSLRAARMYAWRWDRQADRFEMVLPEELERYVPSDLHGMQGFLARVHPDDADRVSRSTQLSLDNGLEFKEEFRFRRGDDQYRWYASVGRPILSETGATTGFVGATQDVTDRRMSQVRVGDYGELLRNATANTADLLLLLDRDLNIRFCNRSINGLSARELAGVSAQRVLNPHDWSMHSEILNAVLLSGTPASFSHEALGDDGDAHCYQNRAVPVYDKGVISGLSVTITDITERLRLEREILEIAAHEQERIGQDLHDGLGQELTGVALMLRALSGKIQRDPVGVGAELDEIVAMVNRTISTVRSLARGLSPINSDRGGLVGALRSLAARSRDSYGLNVRFRSKIWPQLTLDETHSSHLYRIAQEALTNVARHAQATSAEIRLLVLDNKFTFTVSDDGVGLQRTPRSSDGMGLKLMAYRAARIGAELEVIPNEPRGTVVRITGEQPKLL